MPYQQFTHLAWYQEAVQSALISAGPSSRESEAGGGKRPCLQLRELNRSLFGWMPSRHRDSCPYTNSLASDAIHHVYSRILPYAEDIHLPDSFPYVTHDTYPADHTIPGYRWHDGSEYLKGVMDSIKDRELENLVLTLDSCPSASCLHPPNKQERETFDNNLCHEMSSYVFVCGLAHDYNSHKAPQATPVTALEKVTLALFSCQRCSLALLYA